MENKENIVNKLKELLMETEAGSNIADMVLSGDYDKVTIIFREGGSREVDVTGDSGYAIIMDVMKAL